MYHFLNESMQGVFVSVDYRLFFRLKLILNQGLRKFFP
jgi:hypothetical protein